MVYFFGAYTCQLRVPPDAPSVQAGIVDYTVANQCSGNKAKLVASLSPASTGGQNILGYTVQIATSETGEYFAFCSGI